MAKQRSIFVCSACGAHAPKWIGQCADCGEWNSLIESLPVADTDAGGGLASTQAVQRLSAVAIGHNPRFSSGVSELDRVLGSGLVAGSVVLLGGDPGIGKSTLLLQSLSHLSADMKTLYVTG